MPSFGDLAPVAAMVAGLLVQNYAEWRAGGPRLPETVLVRRIFPVADDRTRCLALVIVSVVVAALCVVSLAFGIAWVVVAVAAALILNASAQLVASLRLKRMQPGTLAGLIFMMPPSLWVIIAFGSRSSWLPIVMGPLLSIPILMGVWWLAGRIQRVLGKREIEDD